MNFVAAHFYDTLENGCVVKNIPFIHAQGIKKVKIYVRESRVFPDGSRNYDGDIGHYKYDMYWVDVFVTGSNNGTLSDPIFLFKRMLKVVNFT